MQEYINKKFSTLCDEWLAFKKNLVKESSFLNYKFTINKHLKKDFANMNIEEIKTFDFNKYIDNLKTRFSSKTIRDTFTILKSILRFAERKYDIDFKLDLVSIPTNYKKEIEVFTDKERVKLQEYLWESKKIKEIGVYICLFTGMRIGEICALKWSDIDFENKLIDINQTVQRVYFGNEKSKVIISSPKSKTSVRKIPISKTLYLKLKQLKNLYSKDSFIITGKEKKFTEPMAYRYTYRKVLKKTKVQYRKFHCLRHTFATRCIHVGMDVKSLSEILGHASINITLSTYVHSSYEVKKKYIDKI